MVHDVHCVCNVHYGREMWACWMAPLPWYHSAAAQHPEADDRPFVYSTDIYLLSIHRQQAVGHTSTQFTLHRHHTWLRYSLRGSSGRCEV